MSELLSSPTIMAVVTGFVIIAIVRKVTNGQSTTSDSQASIAFLREFSHNALFIGGCMLVLRFIFGVEQPALFPALLLTNALITHYYLIPLRSRSR